MNTYMQYRIYKRIRQKFALKTYFLLMMWLVLALAQWMTITLIEDGRKAFQVYYFIAFVTFACAIFLFALFILLEKLRFLIAINFIFSVIIVELQIVSTFAFCVLAYWPDILAFYGICVISLIFFLVFGSILPNTIDLTLDVAILFILGFLFLIIAVFFLVAAFVVKYSSVYIYATAEIAVSLAVMVFVMYHAQTIIGSRFAEMRQNDALLGSLLLFHDFLIIYWLTFYWQIVLNPFTPKKLIFIPPEIDFKGVINFTLDDTGVSDMDVIYK